MLRRNVELPASREFFWRIFCDTNPGSQPNSGRGCGTQSGSLRSDDASGQENHQAGARGFRECGGRLEDILGQRARNSISCAHNDGDQRKRLTCDASGSDPEFAGS